MTTIIRPVPPITLEGLSHSIAGQLSGTSKKRYARDAAYFGTWLTDRGVDVLSVSRDDFLDYRAHLDEKYARATAARMFTVARRLLDEASLRGLVDRAVTVGVNGFKASKNETPHRALTLPELRALLGSIDTATGIGRRDYAVIMLMARLGLRVSEAVALTLGDISQSQGHTIITVAHGKGDVRRVAKCPVDVLRAITGYLEITGHNTAPKGSPLFVGFSRGGNVLANRRGVTIRQMENMVKGRADAAGLPGLSPHGLRASFVTLALEGGATLHDVQYAAGHADPRTTERYQKRKLNLDRNAVDFIHL